MTNERATSPTVLVVEDDGAMRLMCRVNLELEGYRVLEADHLDRARQLIADETIDLMLLDVHVRSEDGYDLIGVARERDIPILLMTGSAKVGDAERQLVDAVLPKPFKIDELHSTVSQLTSPRAAH
jgi:two-component system, OmpR family, phosphate regulon response regulator PhoB